MSILIMILLLSLLILVHEAGHFIAARAFGIKVDKFGFGLPVGPTLFKTKIGDVEVLVHALLLGGYVSFPDDEKDSPLPQDSPERFANKPVWQKAVVVSSGVIANIICAFVLVVVVAFTTKQLPSGNYAVYINTIDAPANASIWKSGIKEHDRIVKANGCPINNAYSLVTIIKNSAKFNGYTSQKTIDDNYKKLKKLNPILEEDEVIPDGYSIRLPEAAQRDIIKLDKYVLQGVKYYKPEGIKLSKEMAELSKKVYKQSTYTSDGTYTMYDIATALSNGHHPVTLQVLRDGKVVKLKPLAPNAKGVLGISLSTKQIMKKTKTPSDVLSASMNYLYDNTYLMIYSLGQLFTGNIPLKDMHGVVAITKIGVDMIDKTGTASGILLAALISINLAILNILPIPALDGGHLLFLLIEKIIGRPVSEKFIEVTSTIFFTLLILLMLFVVFNDILLIMQK